MCVQDAVTAESAGQRLHLRVERQTLSRLPRTGAVLFTIRTHMKRLDHFEGRPGAVRPPCAPVGLPHALPWTATTAASALLPLETNVFLAGSKQCALGAVPWSLMSKLVCCAVPSTPAVARTGQVSAGDMSSSEEGLVSRDIRLGAHWFGCAQAEAFKCVA